ncbi:CAP domain-containing protein [Pantanalinema rosaneae CENA516]|uniref:CAP domain-containing protein n=1 Tax=Pantanalinema rosaneae TaxID=1620701 RepID=UPI003D6FBD73
MKRGSLIGLVFLAIGLTACEAIRQFPDQLPSLLPPRQPRSQQSPVPAQSVSTAAMEEQVRQRINAIRQQQGLSELRQHEELAQVARNYSRRMAEQNFFAHQSPQGDTMVQRVESAGIAYRMVGENLFTSTNIPQPVPAAVNGWMNSPGHRANILRSEYQETGIGIWRQGNTYYFTQLFLRSW